MERVGHYELVRLIGRGGMGEVHEAVDTKLRRRVALKFLSPQLTADPAALARFEREAHAAAELTHPHIATVYAFEPDAASPFIAMELLAGPSLRERIAAGPFEVEEALAVARDVAAALAFAHRRGIAHRDIKPENLMFDEHGTIKVMDFGLARATMASKLTVTGTSLGTPAYMSPEAIRGEPGPAGDVFALGLVLYEMLARRRAYPGDNAMAIMFAIANDDPVPLAGVRPDVPDDVAALVNALLAKDPAARPDAATSAARLAALTGVPSRVVSGAFGREPAAGGATAATTTGAVTVAMPAAATTVAMRPRVTTTVLSRLVPAGQRDHPVRFLSISGSAIVAIAYVAIVLSTGAHAKRRDEAERLQLLGTEAANAGRADEARDLYWKALRVDPAQSGALNNLGLMALSEQRYTAAESLFDAVLRHHPHENDIRATALHNAAEVDFARKAYGRALDRLQRAFALDSSSADAYNNLGWALVQNRQSRDALTLLERGIERFPGEARLFKNAGLAALELGDTHRALAHLDAALRLDPSMTEAAELRQRALAGAVPPPAPGVPATP